MTDRGDFDPAKAIQDLRQAEEAEKQRARAQVDQRRADILKLFRYAEQQLEELRDPVVSEFVVTERWWEKEQISDIREERDFEKTLRDNQRLMGQALERKGGILRGPPVFKYTVATPTHRQTRYYGSWLQMSITHSEWGAAGENSIEGLVKLRQPHAGYASVKIIGETNPRVGKIIINLNNVTRPYKYGGERPSIEERISNEGFLQPHESLEEVIIIPVPAIPKAVEIHTERVRKTLDFVATGQTPQPDKVNKFDY